MNIQQQTTSEVFNTESVMDDNGELDHPPLQDILNVFAAVDLSSRSSYDSAKYKRAWLKAKLIRSYILHSEECPDACSRSLYITRNHKEITPIMAVTGAIFPKLYADAITRHEQKKLILSRATSVGNTREQTKDRKHFSYPIYCPLCHIHQRNKIKKKFTQLRVCFNVACQVHIVEKNTYTKRGHLISQVHNTEVKWSIKSCIVLEKS